MKLRTKKFSMQDLELDEMQEDEVFLSVNAAGESDIELQSTGPTSATDWSTNSGSIVTGLTTLATKSTPENTYTEIKCC